MELMTGRGGGGGGDLALAHSSGCCSGHIRRVHIYVIYTEAKPAVCGDRSKGRGG